MITNLRRQRSARTAPIQASIRGRLGSVPGIRDVAVESASDGRDEHTLKLSMLEAEVLGLRQSLAEVKANRDALRRKWTICAATATIGGSWRSRASQSRKGRDGKPGFVVEPRRALKSLTPGAPGPGLRCPDDA
jgi:hypothetical protein